MATPLTSPPSSPTRRVAVVGCGGIARGRHLPALADQGARTSVVALVDLDAAAVERTADEWNVPGRYTDVDAMLAAESPDLVIVCTPPAAHRDTVIAGLEAGAWVWCEKPPVLSLAEYDRIGAHEGERGPYASYVFQHRFGSGATHLRSLLDRRALGRPLVGVCHTLWYRDEAYFEVPWRARWETEGGGPSMGHGIHQMDLMFSLLGDWSEVTAVMSTTARATETEDVSMAIVRLESGATVSVVNSLLSPRETSYLRFDFEHATVELEHLYGHANANWRWTPAEHTDRTFDAAHWPPRADEPSSHGAQLKELLDAMDRGERPAASGRDGRRALELVAGMYRSALTGATVRRSELTEDDPFHHAMYGPDPAAATAVLSHQEETAHV
ncbi:Gfo/Idh/MocA family protein [Nocardiopsis sp. MG754419]|uniref:Gfo/Idh/MocA family protein n=1 Tax=Nocardiopsis sp. MG754419 TaxID=2259865 RepID=UPI001BACE45A|nr:Gfo/Idh/MocA family oxidoreductase [Nocardiopsis sp. MG754419]MBR8740130.1 gfo/Idh/MocA family oxidoreductase [Nocardiopsis sp. MG754419]